MCIRDRIHAALEVLLSPPDLRFRDGFAGQPGKLLPDDFQGCLLYTSDAADDLLCVDLGGRRIIKKKQYPGTDTAASYTDLTIQYTHYTHSVDLTRRKLIPQ